MRALRALSLLLALSLPAAGADLTADQLIAKVLDAQRTTGFRVRARLVRGAPGAEKPEVIQILIKGRREGETSQVLYQILWPTASRGRALVVQKVPGKPVAGFLFEPPDTKKPLTPELLRQPLFGTDLSVEDVAEDYWSWPSQKLAGVEDLAGRPCQILESRPAPGASTGYGRVKSWIDPEIALPLRVEKYGKDGRLAKRFTAENLMKEAHGRWTAAKITVVDSQRHIRTVFEGTKSERDLELPASDFTVEGLQKAVSAGSPEETTTDSGRPAAAKG